MVSTASAQTPAPSGVPAASAEVATWLTQTSAQCDAAYQRDVRGPFEAGLATLRQSYLATIVQAMEKAGEARKLDEANAFRLERERFLGAGHKPPDDDSDNPPDAIKALRSTFRKQFAQLDLERYNRARVLHSRCDPTLAQMELQLTQRQRAADAAAVRAKRDELTKAWLQLPTPGPGDPRAGATTKSPATPKPEVTKETVRETVAWVFSTGGTVSLPEGKEGKSEKEIGDVAQLPSGSFTFARIGLDNAKAAKPFQDADLAPLAGLRSVRFFDFKGLKVTDAAFGFLDGWKDLEKFRLNGSKVSDAVIPKFAHFEALHMIELRNSADVTGRTFDKLAGLKNLHTLDLEKSGITDEGLAGIAQIKSLDELDIPGTAVTDAGIAHLAALHGLHHLQIQGTKVTTAGLAPLSAIHDLEELGFLTSELTDYPGAVKQIGTTWPKLKALRFVGGEVKAVNIEPLAALHGLKELHFQNVDLGEAAISAIGKLPAIDELSITYGTIGDEQIAALATLKRIRILRFNSSKINDASLLKLKPLRGLKEVDVKTTQVTAAGVAALEKELPGCKVLR